MALTVFYAWQSDTPANLNRSLVGRSLEIAIRNINEDLTLEESLDMDQDTRGIPGSPDIANTILQKIESCSIFVADLSFVGETPDGKLLPNPNVLIELGYAMSVVGPGRMIGVMNTAYGPPDKLPFDLRHRRFPILYEAPVDSSSEERRAECSDLVTKFEGAIQAILDDRAVVSPTEAESSEILGTQTVETLSSFLSTNEELGVISDPAFEDGEEGHIIWENGSQAFLRLIPQNATSLRRVDAGKIQQTPGLPMLGRPRSLWWSRNRWGVVTFNSTGAAEHQTGASCFTQLFLERELWSIDKTLLSDSHRGRQIIPSDAVKVRFNAALRDYLSFAADQLKIEGPVKIVAGLDQIQGYCLAYRSDGRMTRLSEPCLEDSVVFEEVLDDLSGDPDELLLPFYRNIWDACGIDHE